MIEFNESVEYFRKLADLEVGTIAAGASSLPEFIQRRREMLKKEEQKRASESASSKYEQPANSQ